MSGAQLELSIQGLDLVYARLRRLDGLRLGELMEGLMSEVENQTRRRFNEKRDPDGVAWVAWSERYAGSKHGAANHPPHLRSLRESGGHTILVLGGDLQDSLMYEINGDEGTIGSNLVYAATHQYGDADRNIPARPYLGISYDNAGDLEQYVVDFLSETLT